MSNRPDWVEVRLDARKGGLSADGAGELLHDFLGLLKAIDKGMSLHGTATVKWEIAEARMASPLSIRLRGDNSSSVIEAIGPGMESLNSDRRCPPHFTMEALNAVKRLVHHSATYGIIPIFVTYGTTVFVQRVAGENADYALRELSLRKTIRREYGSLRGELRELAASSRKQDKMLLVDRLTGEETSCYVGEELDREIRNAWKKRVVVTGTIEMNRETRKKTIHVDRIRLLRESKDLPQLEDLRGIDITGGVESSQYIRNLRDADEEQA
jgi:hypothetical protein